MCECVRAHVRAAPREGAASGGPGPERGDPGLEVGLQGRRRRFQAQGGGTGLSDLDCARRGSCPWKPGRSAGLGGQALESGLAVSCARGAGVCSEGCRLEGLGRGTWMSLVSGEEAGDLER